MRGRVQNPLLRFRLPAVLLAIVIAFGVTGYTLIERWNLFDAFFMTIITISTVGYGEVHPQSVAGRAFSAVLIVVGVGTMLFGFGVFAETLAENAFGMFRRQRQMEHTLQELRDHFISPYRMAGHLMAELAVHPAMVDVLDTLHHGESDIGLEEVLIQPETKAIGKTLADSGLLDAQGAKLLAVRRRDGTLHVNPSADLRLAEGDLIIALGSEQQLLTTASMLN